MILSSSYANNFVNWRNGNRDVYIEKKPQYPVYTLPFKGESGYKESFTKEQLQKIRDQTVRVKKGVHKIT